MFDAATSVFAANKAMRELGVKTEKTATVVYPEHTIELNELLEVEINALGLVAGKKYLLHFDGTTYSRVAVSMDYEGAEIIVLGEDNDPAAFMEVPGEFSILTGSEGTHTYALSAVAETIHPIDPKYIPPLDALYLNGADGKQYAVTIDDTGALTATEVTT